MKVSNGSFVQFDYLLTIILLNALLIIILARANEPPIIEHTFFYKCKGMKKIKKKYEKVFLFCMGQNISNVCLPRVKG